MCKSSGLQGQAGVCNWQPQEVQHLRPLVTMPPSTGYKTAQGSQSGDHRMSNSSGTGNQANTGSRSGGIGGRKGTKGRLCIDGKKLSSMLLFVSQLICPRCLLQSPHHRRVSLASSRGLLQSLFLWGLLQDLLEGSSRSESESLGHHLYRPRGWG